MVRLRFAVWLCLLSSCVGQLGDLDGGAGGGGSIADSGAPIDGGTGLDAGTGLPDAGSNVDAGSTPIDAGAPVDGGVRADAGSIADAGSGVDAGSGTDAGANLWSAPISLVEDLGRLAIGNQLHIVGHLGGYLVHRRSADNGATWSAPSTIAPAAGNFPAMYGGFFAEGDTLALITADDDMDSAASVGGRTIRFRRSTNNGDTWTSPVTLNSAVNPIYRGRVASHGNFIHFAGTSMPTGPDGASEWYFRSIDFGATWTATALASNLGTYGAGQTLAVEGDTVHIAYTSVLTGIGSGPALYIRSTDDGATWSQPVAIGESSSVSDRQARVQLTAADGHVFACWQREALASGGGLPPDRIGYNTSANDGVTWGTARVLPQDMGVERNHQHAWLAPGGGVHMLWRHGDSGDTIDDPAGVMSSFDYGATWQPRTIAIDTTATLAGANHPWAIVANGVAVHVLVGPRGAMQYARRRLP